MGRQECLWEKGESGGQGCGWEETEVEGWGMEGRKQKWHTGMWIGGNEDIEWRKRKCGRRCRWEEVEVVGDDREERK